MSEVRPFLATLPAADDVRPLASTLHRIATPPATSPWSPREPEPPPAPAIDTAAIEAAAREQGRQQGLAETAELRARLAAAIDAFTHARQAVREPTADKIAAAAAAVVAAWTGKAPPRDLYAPIVRAWLDRHAGAASARVAPAHVAELAELVGDAPIAIAGDPALRPGELQLVAPALEMSFSWDRELAGLRDAIAAALEEAP
jgi:flagellar biosynthesis/type III secretory pathway protein FliH